MKIRKRMKRTTKQYFMVAIICILVIGGAATFTSVVVTGQMKEEYQALLTKAYSDMKMNQRIVYVATSDIMAGNYVTTDNVEKRTVYASQPEETYISAEDFGKVAMVDIFIGTQLINSMLTEKDVSAELKEVEYNVINTSSNLVTNDTIDVRISYPNGEDYIVLPKKTIKGVAFDSGTCYLWLSEEEILRMASATVDAFLYNGSRIYTTKYIEPNLQEVPVVTYEPSIATLLLIQDNPNILATATTELSKQVRKAMENRLAASYKTTVEEIDWVLSPNKLLNKEEVPAILEPNENATYQDEVKDKEAELDYGP